MVVEIDESKRIDLFRKFDEVLEYGYLSCSTSGNTTALATVVATRGGHCSRYMQWLLSLAAAAILILFDL